MRPLIALILLFTVSPALAHIGHLGEVAGHGHWIALGGIAIAGAIAILGGRKKPKDAQTEDPETEDEPEEAPA